MFKKSFCQKNKLAPNIINIFSIFYQTKLTQVSFEIRNWKKKKVIEFSAKSMEHSEQYQNLAIEYCLLIKYNWETLNNQENPLSREFQT